MTDVTLARGGFRGAFSHPRLLLAGAAAFSMSTLFSALKPILLTRLLEELAWGEGFVGLVVAAPFIGIAVSSLLFYLRPPKATVKVLGQLFGSLLVILELLSGLFFQAPVALLLMQLGCGFCVGALMAATSRIVAVSSAPDESFGFIDMTAVAMMSLMVAGAGLAVGADGARGGYWFAALMALLFALTISAYREPPTAKAHHANPGAAPQLGLRPLAVIIMGMLFVTCSGLGFTFMFSMATDLGMSYETAGSRIGLLLFVSAAACQVGGWASGRFGPRYPLLGAFTVCAAGWWMAIHAPTPMVFFVGLVPAIFALQFTFPVLLALAGSLDEHGRWAGIAAPLITSGFAWAAVSAGLLVERFQVPSLALATAIGMAVCALLLWPATEVRE